MHLDYEDYIRDIAEHANSHVNSIFDVHQLKSLKKPGFNVEIFDSPSIYYLPGKRPEHDAVLIVSQKAHPDFVEKAVNNASRARDVLSYRCAAVVSKPVISNRFRGLSYAIWPEHRPVSEFRLIRAMQKKWLNPKVFSWLHNVAADTANRNVDSKSVEQKFRDPLEHVAANELLPEKLRTAANQGLRRLVTGNWNPITVLQHSDFWLGNILFLNKRAWASDNYFGFYVIDWGGALVEGAPAFDLLRYCFTTGVPLQQAKQELLLHAKSAQIEPRELVYYLIIALGRIGMKLEQFPEYRYIEMCTSTFDYIQPTKSTWW